MPEINYNNPEFELNENNIYQWMGWSSSEQSQGAFLYSQNSNQGVYTWEFLITSFAQQDFLILLTASGTSSINLAVDQRWEITCDSGMWSISAPSSNISLNKITILSTLKRYFRFFDSSITIHPSDFVNQKTIKNISMYYYDLPSVSFYPGKVFYISTSEWSFYDDIISGSYDIQEFPIYKIVETVGETEVTNYYKRTSPSVIGTIMKARGAHFLITSNNQTKNELSDRHFSSASMPVALRTSLITNEKNICSRPPNIQNPGSYQTLSSANKILSSAQTNKTINIPEEDLPQGYNYFSVFFKDTSANTYQADFGKTLKYTKETPYTFYNDINIAADSSLFGEDFTSIALRNKLFWIDRYTLYYNNKIYLIPYNWKVKILRTYSDIERPTSNFNYISETTAGQAWSNVYTDPLGPAFSLTFPRLQQHHDEFLLTRRNKLTSVSDYIWASESKTLQFKTNISSNIDARFQAGLKSAYSNTLFNGSFTVNLPLVITTPSFLSNYWTGAEDTGTIINDGSDDGEITKWGSSGIFSVYANKTIAHGTMPALATRAIGNITIHFPYNGLLQSSLTTYDLGRTEGSNSDWGLVWTSFAEHSLKYHSGNKYGYCIIAYDPDL